MAHTFVAVASGAVVSSDVNMGCVADGETADGVAVGGVTGAPVSTAAVWPRGSQVASTLAATWSPPALSVGTA